ncbi:hypothetical protein PN836_019820 [Ningiella sp. W23]|uniref:hypothetical protein n=1 Tax=Ningiella sp. W23 TaxID=3023715 RepID=UPI0037578A10
MKALKFATFALTFLMFSSAQAALIKFNATGVVGVSGFVEFDDSTFDGSSDQFLSNTAITDLSLNVFGEVFSLADVATGDSTIMDSSGLFPIIVNGAGNLADNGNLSIAFFPDGFSGTASDGDASLSTGPGGAFADDEFFAVKWELDAAEVSAPNALLLLGSGLLFLCARRTRKA